MVLPYSPVRILCDRQRCSFSLLVSCGMPAEAQATVCHVVTQAKCLACHVQVVPSGSLAVFTEDDTAAAAIAAKPDPLAQMQATISELQQQIQAMAKTQEAMANCLLGKQSGTDEQNLALPAQSESEATSPSLPKSEPTEGSSKSWLPSMPSILGRT